VAAPQREPLVAELTFVGAAGVVTGSKHLLTIGGKHAYIDSGLFQGPADVCALNDMPLPLAAQAVEAVVVTHGHIDHVGYLPKLVRNGFNGTIFCTPATAKLMAIVLEDAVGLQHHLHARGFDREHPHAQAPLYEEGDVRKTLRLIKATPLHTSFTVAGAEATFLNAGHIIGSAFVKIVAEGRTVVFSGDLGRYGRPLLYDPDPIDQADTIVCESTYGDRIHPPDALGQLHDALLAALKRGGPIVIPAFAVERSQDLIYAIGRIKMQEPTLMRVPVYLDSPMASKVDDLFATCRDAHRPVPEDTPSAPLGCPDLIVAQSAEESKQIDTLRGSAIVISASGMASGGRVLHHLYRTIPNDRATILFVGYQSAQTLGFYLTHGAQTIKMYGDRLPVRAHVAQIGGYSAHADQAELLRWLGTCSSKPNLYAVHGELASAQAFAEMVHERLRWSAQAAVRGTSVRI
jgi:metallo-beta-lactamase family protein